MYPSIFGRVDMRELVVTALIGRRDFNDYLEWVLLMLSNICLFISVNPPWFYNCHDFFLRSSGLIDPYLFSVFLSAAPSNLLFMIYSTEIFIFDFNQFSASLVTFIAPPKPNIGFPFCWFWSWTSMLSLLTELAKSLLTRWDLAVIPLVSSASYSVNFIPAIPLLIMNYPTKGIL